MIGEGNVPEIDTFLLQPQRPCLVALDAGIEELGRFRSPGIRSARDRLKRRASNNNRSLEGEARHILICADLPCGTRAP